jgi:hypothetical protein
MLSSKIWTYLKHCFIRLYLFLFPVLRAFDNLTIILPTYYKNTENHLIFVLGHLKKNIVILEQLNTVQYDFEYSRVKPRRIRDCLQNQLLKQ